MLALSPLLGKIGGKGGVPMANVLGSVVEGVAQIPGATFLHVRLAVFKLSGLVGRGRTSPRRPAVRQGSQSVRNHRL